MLRECPRNSAHNAEQTNPPTPGPSVTNWLWPLLVYLTTAQNPPCFSPIDPAFSIPASCQSRPGFVRVWCDCPCFVSVPAGFRAGLGDCHLLPFRGSLRNSVCSFCQPRGSLLRVQRSVWGPRARGPVATVMDDMFRDLDPMSETVRR